MSSDRSNQSLTHETIRRITLGRSMECINLAPGGISDIGTVRMIHGYVAKIHDNLSNEEFSDYGGTIDVGKYPDETASTEPVIHRGVLLSAATNSEGGLLIVPTLFSDVTIFMDTATRYAYVANFSHVDILRLNARTETVIDITEMEELGPENDSSPDYDELETTGNETSTHYTPMAVITTVRNDKGKEAITIIGAESTTHTVDKSEVRQTTDKVVRRVNSTTVTATGSKVTFSSEDATKPPVPGSELARLMLSFLTEYSKVVTPTLMGVMSLVSMSNFISLTSRIQRFLSRTSYTR